MRESWQRNLGSRTSTSLIFQRLEIETGVFSVVHECESRVKIFLWRALRLTSLENETDEILAERLGRELTAFLFRPCRTNAVFGAFPNPGLNTYLVCGAFLAAGRWPCQAKNRSFLDTFSGFCLRPVKSPS